MGWWAAAAEAIGSWFKKEGPKATEAWRGQIQADLQGSLPQQQVDAAKEWANRKTGGAITTMQYKRYETGSTSTDYNYSSQAPVYILYVFGIVFVTILIWLVTRTRTMN